MDVGLEPHDRPVFIGAKPDHVPCGDIWVRFNPTIHGKIEFYDPLNRNLGLSLSLKKIDAEPPVDTTLPSVK